MVSLLIHRLISGLLRRDKHEIFLVTLGIRTNVACPTACPTARARKGIRLRYRWPGPSLSPCADAHDHRTLPCPAPCRARVAPTPKRRRRAIALWAHKRQATSLATHAREPIQWPHADDRYRATHRALPARLPPYADYFKTPNPRASRSCCAFCSSHYHSSSPCQRRSTNRSSTPFSSRFNLRFSPRCDLRPSPALFAQPPRKINTIAPPHSTPHTHQPPSAHITMDAPRCTRTRARRSTLRSTSSPTSSPPGDTNPPSTGVPSPAARHACGAASVGLASARARPVRMLHAHAHEAACARCPLPRLPDSVDSAPAEARRHSRWPSARASERAPPRLFC